MENAHSGLVVALVPSPSLSPPALRRRRRPPEPRPPGTGRLEVTMTGFESEEGQARVAFFLDATELARRGGVPLRRRPCLPIRTGRPSPVRGRAGRPLRGLGLPRQGPRRRAGLRLHGHPSEAYGFSADARDMFGPPSFEEARLELAAGESKQITIQVK